MTDKELNCVVNVYHNQPIVVDYLADPFQLMACMRRQGMTFTIESEADYRDQDTIELHETAINALQDYGIHLNWGDSNCPYRKPYDPTDGHGFTDIYVIGDSFARAVLEAYARAVQIYNED